MIRFLIIRLGWGLDLLRITCLWIEFFVLHVDLVADKIVALGEWGGFCDWFCRGPEVVGNSFFKLLWPSYVSDVELLIRFGLFLF